jgi:hypothetical protein
MKRIYTTANGRRIDIDAIISQNEETIAVGNMGVNARGDQLGPGGIVDTPKNKAMADYYKLNTPTAVDTPPQPHQRTVKKDLTDDWLEPPAQPEITAPADSVQTKPALRGSLADSVAKNKSTEQEVSKKSGPTRI